jgi:hypothetical protein
MKYSLQIFQCDIPKFAVVEQTWLVLTCYAVNGLDLSLQIEIFFLDKQHVLGLINRNTFLFLGIPSSLVIERRSVCPTHGPALCALFIYFALRIHFPWPHCVIIK